MGCLPRALLFPNPNRVTRRDSVSGGPRQKSSHPQLSPWAASAGHQILWFQPLLSPSPCSGWSIIHHLMTATASLPPMRWAWDPTLPATAKQSFQARFSISAPLTFWGRTTRSGGEVCPELVGYAEQRRPCPYPPHARTLPLQVWRPTLSRNITLGWEPLL